MSYDLLLFKSVCGVEKVGRENQFRHIPLFSRDTHRCRPCGGWRMWLPWHRCMNAGHTLSCVFLCVYEFQEEKKDV